MRRGLAGGVGAIVATDTVSRNVHVVEVGRQPGNRCMTVLTIVAAGNMRRMFSNRSNAVVARATGSDDLRMIDGKRG